MSSRSSKAANVSFSEEATSMGDESTLVKQKLAVWKRDLSSPCQKHAIVLQIRTNPVPVALNLFTPTEVNLYTPVETTIKTAVQTQTTIKIEETE
jgi:hypothetical protein